METFTLATTPQDKRIHIYQNRITFFLFWTSPSDRPIILINPNITDFARNLKNGVPVDRGTVEISGDMKGIQFTPETRMIPVAIGRERLQITLQQQRDSRNGFDTEIDLFVEQLEPDHP